MQFNNPKLRLTACLTALFLVIAGAKLWVIQVYATAIPYWDQWSEARLLFKPWLEGHLTWGALFAPHNEHRIFFTRVLDLFVVRLNGQWDPLLQMTINAFIHAGFACGLAYCLWVLTGKKREGLICFLLAPFFAFPFAMDNTIHGFQSQMYFVSIFALAAIIWLGFGSPGSVRWFFGLAAAMMSIVTMGSGLLASLAVIGLMIVRMLKEKRIARKQIITLGCCLAVFVFGLLLHVNVEGDKPFKAKSFPAFLDALTGNLAWPFGDQPAMSFFVCLPLIITVVEYFRSDFKSPRAAEFLIAFGFWGFLQSAALAYGRVNLGNSSRYLDMHCAIPIASLVSWLVIWQGAEFRRFSRWLTVLLAIVWTGSVFAGMWQISRGAIADRGTVDGYWPWTRQLGLVQEENVRAFVATGDPKYLQNKPVWHIPAWDSGWLIESLRDPKLSRIMPAACRSPLKLEKGETSDASFVLDGYPPGKPKREFTRVWGNYSTNETATPGHFVSQPLSATLPELNIQLCCDPGTNGISLQLVEQQTGRIIKLSPKIIGRWHTITIAAPRNPFRLEITDQSRDSWVAVGEIQEMGRLSYYALLLLNHAVAILLTGLLLCVLLAGFSVACHRAGFWRDGFAEFLVLLLALIALAGVWLARNFDTAEFTRKLHQRWAAHFESEGDLRSAELHFRESLWLKPDDPETFTNLANAILRDPGLEKDKARAEAALDYEAALRLKPDSPEIKNQLRALGVSIAR